MTSNTKPAQIAKKEVYRCTTCGNVKLTNGQYIKLTVTEMGYMLIFNDKINIIGVICNYCKPLPDAYTPPS